MITGGVETKLTLRLDENGVLHATAVHQKMAMGGVVYESTVRDSKINIRAKGGVTPTFAEKILKHKFISNFKFLL